MAYLKVIEMVLYRIQQRVQILEIFYDNQRSVKNVYRNRHFEIGVYVNIQHCYIWKE